MKYTLKDLRKKKGLTQKQLASELGLGLRTVSKWENNPSTIVKHFQLLLSYFYGVSVKDIDFTEHGKK